MCESSSRALFVKIKRNFLDTSKSNRTYSYCEVGGVAGLEPAPGRVLPPLRQDSRLPSEHDASVHWGCTGVAIKQGFRIPYQIFGSVFTRLKLPKM